MQRSSQKMNTLPGRQRKPLSVRLIIGAFCSCLFLIVAGPGCGIINDEPSIITDVEKGVEKELSQEQESKPDREEYKLIEETETLKIIAVVPHADLKVLGRQLADESKNKSLMQVDVYDSENEARNYRVRYDPNISPEDAALEDNEDALVAVYKKNANAGENYIEIYHDIAREDVEVVKY